MVAVGGIVHVVDQPENSTSRCRVQTSQSAAKAPPARHAHPDSQRAAHRLAADAIPDEVPAGADIGAACYRKPWAVGGAIADGPAYPRSRRRIGEKPPMPGAIIIELIVRLCRRSIGPMSEPTLVMALLRRARSCRSWPSWTRTPRARPLTAASPRRAAAPHADLGSPAAAGREAALRMLLNNLDPDVAERPQDLVVYGGTGKAARSRRRCSSSCASSPASRRRDPARAVGQSGRGPAHACRCTARAHRQQQPLVPAWADWPHFWELERRGLMMYGQMTAGSWIYIGTQGILQAPETFAAAAPQALRSDGRHAAGRLVVSGGLGGMGGAQPLG